MITRLKNKLAWSVRVTRYTNIGESLSGRGGYWLIELAFLGPYMEGVWNPQMWAYIHMHGKAAHLRVGVISINLVNKHTAREI